MENLKKLEEAINDLKAKKDNIIELLQKHGWKDNRSNTKIPEEIIITKSIEMCFEQEETIPEQVPLKSGIVSLYQSWYNAARIIIEKNQPYRIKEFDEAYTLLQFASQKVPAEDKEFHRRIQDRLARFTKP